MNRRSFRADEKLYVAIHAHPDLLETGVVAGAAISRDVYFIDRDFLPSVAQWAESRLQALSASPGVSGSSPDRGED